VVATLAMIDGLALLHATPRSPLRHPPLGRVPPRPLEDLRSRAGALRWTAFLGTWLQLAAAAPPASIDLPGPDSE
jgi:hypothetical protein